MIKSNDIIIKLLNVLVYVFIYTKKLKVNKNFKNMYKYKKHNYY